MKPHIFIAIVLLTAHFAFAQSPTTPSDESLKELISLSGSEKLVTDMQSQLKTTMAATTNKALANQSLPPNQRAIIEKMQGKIYDLIGQQFSWTNMENLYLQIYRESFSQDEIDQLITFYKSPTGQIFVTKMPAIMQKSMALMQQQMGPLMEQIKAIQKEATAEIMKEKAAKSQ